MDRSALLISFDPHTHTAMAPVALSRLTLERFERCGFVRKGDMRNVVTLGERLSVLLRELAEETEQHQADADETHDEVA